ncbi:MAG: hypothetical protein ACRERU_06910 [Methylococcales bacterium]
MIRKIQLIVLATLLSSNAVAAEQFSVIDSDKDGSINRAEAQGIPTLYNNWNKVDLNADGVVDQAEFSKFEAMPTDPEDSESGGEIE